MTPLNQPPQHPQQRKIDDDILLKMIGEGKMQKECAEFFKCSAVAISKRLKKLNPAPVEPLLMDTLTGPQKKFVIEMANGASQTQAAFQAYDVTSRDSAKSLGSELMQNPAIREAIEEICNREGLTREHLIRRLKQHVDGKDPGTSIRATELGLKVHGELVEKKVRVNINLDLVAPVDLSKYRNRLPEISAEAERLQQSGEIIDAEVSDDPAAA
jgi:phage terminase small subunit